MLIRLVCGTEIQVDECDLALVHRYTWRLRKGGPGQKDYVVRGGSKYLHREILRATPGQVVDHRNGDTLDFRRINLRVTTAQGNAQNQGKKRGSPYGSTCTSRFKGVSIDRRAKRKPWKAQIRLPDGRMKNLGQYADEAAAAHAYDVASLQLHGATGRRNFLPLVSNFEASMV